jgi:hemoglobin-like flavoprotein
MTPQQIDLVRSTWRQVAKLPMETVGELFYGRLFEVAPEVKPLFTSPVPEQSRKLLMMVGFVVSKLDKLEELVADVQALGRRHADYKVEPEHYTIVGSTLLWTLEQGLGEAWTDDAEEAWATAYTILSSVMIEASSEVVAARA